MQWIQTITGIFALAAITTSAAAKDEAGIGDFNLPAPYNLSRGISLHATAYIVQGANESSSQSDPLLVGPDGSSLGVRVSTRKWCLAAEEGSLSVSLKSGAQRDYAYSGQGKRRIADCRAVFEKTKPKLVAALERSTFRPAPPDAPYGIGATAIYRLVPFRSIAIDRAIGAPLKLGQIIFIPRLRRAKITLADGTQVRHDGYVMAVDTGGAIKGNHIDFFEGPRKNDHLIPEISKSFEGYVVNDRPASELLDRLHSRLGPHH